MNDSFSADVSINEVARSSIIDAVDIPSMKECAEKALEAGDMESANFWYVEWITAPNIAPSVAAEGILQYAHQFLMPQRRFSEAELYLTWVTRCAEAPLVDEATRSLQTLHRTRGAFGLKRHRSENDWQNIDASQPLDPRLPSDLQHRRSISWLEARSESGDLDIIANPWSPEHLSHIAGFVIGVRNSSEKNGSDFEAQVQGLSDWITFRVDKAASTQAKSAAASQRAAKPRPAPTPKTAKAHRATPQGNALGQHIDELFDNEKMRHAIKMALNAVSGFNDDYIIAAIPVTSKLGDGEDRDNYMIFTNERAAIVKRGGLFSSAETEMFTRKMIDYVGVGDSDHYEGQGFGGRTTNWISITIELRQGLNYTRHYFLGSSEKEINSNLPFIRSAFERLGHAGYAIASGPAWTSSGGYHTSYSYGFGVWT